MCLGKGGGIGSESKSWKVQAFLGTPAVPRSPPWEGSEMGWWRGENLPAAFHRILDTLSLSSSRIRVKDPRVSNSRCHIRKKGPLLLTGWGLRDSASCRQTPMTECVCTELRLREAMVHSWLQNEGTGLVSEILSPPTLRLWTVLRGGEEWDSHSLVRNPMCLGSMAHVLNTSWGRRIS